MSPQATADAERAIQNLLWAAKYEIYITIPSAFLLIALFLWMVFYWMDSQHRPS